MPIPYTQTSMALVRAVDGTYISYPFVDRGDTNTKVYNLVCTQRASDYNAAQIDLDDNMSSAANAGVIELPTGWADSNAYFVGDTGHSPLPGGMLQFTRTFANIPAYSQTSTGSYGYTFPGLGGFAATTLEESDISSVSMTLGTLGVTVVTSDALTLSVGDKIDMLLKYKDAGSDFVYVISGEVFVLSVTNTTTFTADIGRYFDSQTTLTLVSGEVRKPSNENRPPLQQQGQLTESLTYILPGVTVGVTSTDDIQVPPIFAPWEIVISEGSPTQYNRVNVLSTSSTPTSADYLTMMKNGESIIAESSLQKWLGNILVQSVKTVKAL